MAETTSKKSQGKAAADDKNAAPKKSKLATPESWPASKIILRKVADLVPYARNARTHSKSQIAKIKASIQEFGFTNPVLIKGEDDTIGAGHGRVMAASELGYEVVPTIEAHGWSDEKFRAYVLADNRLALDAGWDDEMLAVELAAIAETDFDTALTGFDERELTKILSASLKDENEDNAPEKPEQEYTVSRPGDIWCMGKHRLIVGNCCHEGVVKQLLAGVTPNLMVTDPPYGIEFDPKWREEVEPRKKERSNGTVQNDDRADWTEAWQLFKGDIAYVWHASEFAGEVKTSLQNAGLNFRSHIVWNKINKVFGRGAYHWQHECAWYVVRKSKNADWRGGRDQSTVWDVPNAQSAGADNGDDAKTKHGTQKPVELYRRAIQNHTNEGMAVYDPFCGSGTLIIACEQLDRIGFGVEIDTGYADVIVERWQNFTGESATLLETENSFEVTRKIRSTK